MSGRLRPFFKYYGSKYRIALKYPTPRYRDLVEPFAGSASYATAHHTHNVILVERDPEVASLWRWLIGADPAEIRALPVALPQGVDLRSVQARPEAQLLMRYWQRVGMSRTWTVSKWGHLSGFWCAGTRDRIAAQVQAIRHWRVFEGSIVGHHMGAVATWFLDPPYQMQKDVYRNGGTDFAQLSVWTQSLRGQVIVCEAPGATWLPFEPFISATVGPGATGNSHAKRLEMIWTGGAA